MEKKSARRRRALISPLQASTSPVIFASIGTSDPQPSPQSRTPHARLEQSAVSARLLRGFRARSGVRVWRALDDRRGDHALRAGVRSRAVSHQPRRRRRRRRSAVSSPAGRILRRVAEASTTTPSRMCARAARRAGTRCAGRRRSYPGDVLACSSRVLKSSACSTAGPHTASRAGRTKCATRAGVLRR